MIDGGDVKFSVELDDGAIAVTVRPPLGLPSSAVTSRLYILDFLDSAARLTLELNAKQRQLMRQLQNGTFTNGAPASGAQQS